MTGFSKFVRKVLPRIGAAVLAAACGLLLFAVNYFVLFVPDSSNKEIKFEIPDTSDKNTSSNKTPEVNKQDNYNILVMGHDRAASLTDVIMLINYNVAEQSVTIMQFPRDTYVTVGDYYYHKINGLYNYCIAEVRDEGSSDPEKDGCVRMAEYLEKNLAVTIHYSAVMDLDGFEGIVDAIGGVDMYVPQDMYYTDPGQNLYINLKEGYQHLDGDKAEQFVRYRSGYVTGDIGRGNAQKLFISAFISSLTKSLANADASMISNLAGNVINYVRTDMTVADVVYLGKCFLGIGKGGGVKMENISMMTMPGAATMYDGASFFVMNKAYVADIINEYYNIYDYDITKSFDTAGFFVSREQSIVSEIYSADKESVTLTVYNASSLDENGLE
ncbi:MAG: LCP family protein [Candidatus Avispirillum sp.]